MNIFLNELRFHSDQGIKVIRDTFRDGLVAGLH